VSCDGGSDAIAKQTSLDLGCTRNRTVVDISKGSYAGSILRPPLVNSHGRYKDDMPSICVYIS
jgi:hypothetical protein